MFPLRSTPYTNFAFSPTQSFITVSNGRSADLFDIETGQKLRTVDLWGGINTVNFSPDGKKICAMIFGASRTKISLWDWETFEIISVVTIHERSVVGNFSADGKKFSTWRPNLAQWILEDRISTVQLWNVSSKGLTKAIKISDTNICRVSFNPSSAYLVIQTPRQIKIWDCESRSLVSTITEAPSARPQWLIGDIHFSPDGQRLGVFLREYLETPAAFDVRTLPLGTALDSIIPDQISKQSSRIVPSADWTKVVSVIGATQLEIYDLQEGVRPNGARNVSSMVFYFKVTPIGPILAVVDESRKGFQLWDVTSDKEAIQLGEDEGEPIRSMALSPNGRMVAETPWSRVFVWDVDTRQRVELPHGVESPVLSLNFSPNSELLAAEFRQSAGSLNLCVWNVHTQTQVWKQNSDGTGAWYSYCLGFSPDSSSIMSFDEHYIYIANIKSKDDTYGHHTDRIYYIRGAISPTGRFMAVLAAERADSNKKRIEIMEIGRRLRRVDVIFFSDTSDKHQLTFSGDGKYIACGPLCWDISSIPAQLHIGPLPPPSFEETLHSFLTFKDGWIHSAYPPAPLLPIPSYFQGRVTDSWYLCRDYAILKWSQSGPLVVDCSPWLARIRERI
ncbi:hypothetical protein FRC20_003670 [Serendipita sp. 405]|nr:hypothetical protein FRC15_007139 [Serendipita sp. 397]KAG8843984.1 hypothetical protein FRC20_003670 [Serendipita sp. 405]